MKHRMLPTLLLWLLLATLPAWGDTLTIPRIEADLLPEAVIQNSRYLKGSNPAGERVSSSLTMRLKYTRQAYGSAQAVDAYYGAGVGLYLTSRQLGSPLLVYIAQGGTIANLTARLSLNYELNLGLAIGWKAYEESSNESNRVLGSRVTSYIGGDVFLRFLLNQHWDLSAGYGYTHFSNANLRLPNEGLNAMGLRLSAAYYPHRGDRMARASLLTAATLPRGQRWATDVILFGGWKRVAVSDDHNYGVAGLTVSPTYRLNKAIALGPALDAIYDASVAPRLTVGLQVRAELTMPVFRASAGAGRMVAGGMKCFYETLAMKADISRHLFLNIGYTLYNFNYTNHLMLGVGVRFAALR